MAVLLVTAFLSLDAVSLLLAGAVGAGMALPEGARRRVWALAVLPALGVLLLEQYRRAINNYPIIRTSL